MRFGRHLRAVSARAFFRDAAANVAVLFAVAAVPIFAAAGFGLDYIRIQNESAHLQKAVDAAALGLVANASSLSSADLATQVQKIVEGNLADRGLTGLTVASAYDGTARTLDVQASGGFQTTIMKVVGSSTVSMTGRARASVGGGLLPICVMVTSPTSQHTLYTGGVAKIRFDSCMVQVNTSNWDAVEAENSSSILSTNGENCFVGKIHFGNIVPDRNPSCTFFTDPLAGLPMPASAGTCSQTNLTVTTNGTTLTPGTYCGNTTIRANNVTLQSGLYIIRDGNFSVVASSNVIAVGVTFLLTGKDPTFSIGGTASVVQSPAPASVAGSFGGMSLYLDSAATLSSCSPSGPGPAGGGTSDGKGVLAYAWPHACVSGVYGNASYTTSGIVYLARMAFSADDNAQVTINSGSLVADYLVAGSSATLSLTGSNDTSTSAAIAMRKYSEATASQARLVK
jgi:Flp pilus assembly protein TadG